jgi:hypothetical protein
MLFERRLRDGLADGTITTAFRRWRRPQVVAGHRYRTGGDGPMVLAEAVDVVRPDRILTADARAAGYPSPAALIADLRGDPGLQLFRIVFAVVDGPDPRQELATSDRLDAADLAELTRSLSRLDHAAGTDGPWVEAVLRLLAERPAVAAGELAGTVGLPRDVFKRRVRSLKERGLTVSLPVGYRLSPRGEAYLVALDSSSGSSSGSASSAGAG